MRRNRIIPLLGCLSLLFTACDKAEEQKDDYFVFDFGTQARMLSQGFLKENKADVSTDQDLGGYIIANFDDRLEIKTEYSGSSHSLNELIREEISTIKLRGKTEKEIFVASSYYDHSAGEQIILFVESIGSGQIDYTISIEDIIALRKKGHIQSELSTPFARPSLTTR